MVREQARKKPSVFHSEQQEEFCLLHLAKAKWNNVERFQQANVTMLTTHRAAHYKWKRSGSDVAVIVSRALRAERGMLRWSVHLEGGPRRVNHAAVSVGHKVYSFGGYCSGEDYETLRQIDVHVFNTGA
ncbi:uncharacterized protein klhdc3 [Danio aesculapii]|uniref:uncharacterized protein klhdc3 n=1 Tax=Danio aesculapii TaxID=1142201 RepID=UPI0024BF6FA7|nr:uncharacterized protein klhdc3 [Danio aesculapii]